MKHWIFVFALLLGFGVAYATTPNVGLADYQHELQMRKGHRFNENQIRSFVYHWFGLHDDHVDIQRSYARLCPSHLFMVFPEITVHNKADYKKWYTGVGKNIRSNLHRVQKLEITFLPNHEYRVHVVVNWRAINRQNKFINMIADQTWLLRDSNSTEYPCIQEYKIKKFIPAS